MSSDWHDPDEEEEEEVEPETSTMDDMTAEWYARYDGYGRDDIDDTPEAIDDSYDAYVDDSEAN